MTRMTGPDCAVMCNSINIHTHIHMPTASNIECRKREAHINQAMGLPEQASPIYSSELL